MKVIYFFDVELFYQKYSEVFDASSHMNQAVILAKNKLLSKKYWWGILLSRFFKYRVNTWNKIAKVDRRSEKGRRKKKNTALGGGVW